MHRGHGALVQVALAARGTTPALAAHMKRRALKLSTECAEHLPQEE
jgi:hypothetical protein